MTAYYNEFDPLKAETLREAIKAGAIAPGDVDERSIKEVQPADLVGYTQCHFFAGGGFWSLALRNAGWPDDRAVWTGSCPCPSFSAAGKGGGFDDPRHLWPDWARLIRECCSPVIFGEQADDAVGYGWLDLVQTDLEAQAYSDGKIVFGAHSVGAPHIRQRLYFIAHLPGERCREEGTSRRRPSQRIGDCGESEHGSHAASVGHDRRRSGETRGESLEPERSCDARGDADAMYTERRPFDQRGKDGRDGADSGRQEARGIAGTCSEVLGGEHTFQPRLEGHFGDVRSWRGPGWLDPHAARSVAEAGATRGFWRDCDWWYGRDDRYRPIGPGLFPLAHGSAARVGRLRLYGDAIVVPQAQAFIEAVMEVLYMEEPRG